MSELDEAIESLEWNRRLREVRLRRPEKKSETGKFGTLEVIIAFFVGLLFGVILTGVPVILGLV